MLEYCSPLWSPVSIQLVNQLESVQRRFTKRYLDSRVSGVITLRRPCGIEYCGCVCVCFMLILMFAHLLAKYMNMNMNTIAH